MNTFTIYFFRLARTFVVIATIMISGCDILNVSNPNSLVEIDLDNPASASALANGAEATLTRALGSVLAASSTVSDELTWIGTRDAWLELNQGRTVSTTNEFVDEAFSNLSEARWTADFAIEKLIRFRSQGSLRSVDPLVHAYIIGAVTYLTIADHFEDFVLSDRTVSSPPIGKENIGMLYQTALVYLNNALELAPLGSPLYIRALAVRARLHHAKALREKLAPEIQISHPLVSSQLAADDAIAALGFIGGTNWRYEIIVSPQTPGNSLAFNVNTRLELRIGTTYGQPTTDQTRLHQVTLSDPIDGIPAPSLVAAVNEFVSSGQYANVTVVSKRELLLILSEHALALNNGEFSGYINQLRELDGLTLYEDQISARELLIHSRQVNLFLQGRRLADLYRFELTSPQWVSSIQTVGAFFPITISEINANPYVNF